MASPFLLFIGGFIALIVLGTWLGVAYTRKRTALDHKREAWERRQRTAIVPGAVTDHEGES